MMIDSAFIFICLSDLSSANSIAELHITQRQQEEHYRDYHKDHVLHTTSSNCKLASCQPQNLTRMSMSTNDSSLRKSGNHTVLPCPPQPEGPCAARRVSCMDEFPLLQAKNWGYPLLVYGTPPEPGGVIPP